MRLSLRTLPDRPGTVLTRCLFAAMILACKNPSEAVQRDEVVVVGGGEAGQLLVVDPIARSVDRIGSWGRYPGPYARSPDGALLYFGVFSEAQGLQLVAFDLRSLRVSWVESLSQSGRARVIDGVEFPGGVGALAVSPDGSRLFVWPGVRDGVRGIAVLDARTRSVLGFVGPVEVTAGLTTLPSSGSMPLGAVLAIGARTTDLRPSADSLLIVDPATLGVRSVDPVPSSTGLRLHLWQVVPAPGSENVYIVASSGLYKYDLARASVIAQVARPTLGRLAVAPNGAALYLTDPGSFFDSPGSGRLFVFGPDLVPRDPIDLRSAMSGDTIPVTRAATVSRDGKTVYVTSGTSSRGPLYGTQPGRLFVVDAPANRVRSAILLGDWSVGPPWLR